MSAAGDCVLAIDLGTSGPKVGVVTTRGEVLAHAFAPVELLLFPNGGAEQRPDDWWRAVVYASREALAAAAVPRERVAAVSVTAQWSGTVAIDAEHRPLGNALIWMDSRGRRHIDRLRRGALNVQGYGATKLWRWIRLTGGAPGASGKDPVAHIAYLREAEPATYARARAFLEPKDYLNLRLTGEVAATTDSIALHWLTDNRDLSRVRYDDRLLAMSGLDAEKLPRLIAATDVLGALSASAAEELGLSPATRVIGGTPDVQSAAVGSGAARDFAYHLYVGTSDWLTTHVPFKKTDLTHNIASLPAALPGKYLAANSQECAGVCLSSIRALLDPSGATSYDALFAEAAASPAGAGKLVFLPWLYGERTPIEDSRVRGGFLNWSLATRRGDVVRGVLEGVAYNVRWLLGHVERFAGRRAEVVHMVGGGARSALWCSVMADVLDRPVAQMAEPILVNVRGAALLAAVALGELSAGDVDALVPTLARHEPRREHRALYDELYAVFREAFAQNRRSMHRLNA